MSKIILFSKSRISSDPGYVFIQILDILIFLTSLFRYRDTNFIQISRVNLTVMSYTHEHNFTVNENHGYTHK